MGKKTLRKFAVAPWSLPSGAARACAVWPGSSR